MRSNTYARLETVYSKFKGYIGTKELLEEGFSNRQIALWQKRVIWKKYVMVIIG